MMKQHEARSHHPMPTGAAPAAGTPHETYPNKVAQLPTLAALVERLGTNLATTSEPPNLQLTFGNCAVSVASHEPKLLECLAHYFAPFVTATGQSAAPEAPAAADIHVTAIHTTTPPNLGLTFTDWEREPGKTGRKEAYADLADGRVVLKVRTGMQFLLGARERVAIGDCLSNDNQVVNFIISQYINHVLHQDYVLCHAAAVTQNGFGLAIAGTSGAGKSTLALKLLNQHWNFCSNDRLMVSGDNNPHMCGVPKSPRVNPGTMLANDALRDLLPADRQQALAALTKDALWELEEKYDAVVHEVYGPNRWQMQHPLHTFLVLNWSRHSTAPTELKQVDIRQRPDLLAAIMKPPGPFYQPRTGAFPSGVTKPNPPDYLAALLHVRIVEATGAANFEAAVAECQSWQLPSELSPTDRTIYMP